MRSMREIHRSRRPVVNLKNDAGDRSIGSDKRKFRGKSRVTRARALGRHSSTLQSKCLPSSLPPSSAASPPSRRPRSKYVFHRIFFRIRRAHPTRRSSPNIFDGFLSLPTRPRPIAGEGNSRVGDRGRASTTREWFYRRESR